MKVYVLFHHDIEVGELRGIYARPEDAARDLPVEVFTYKPGHRDRQDEGEQCVTNEHGEWCCSVEEWDVRDEPIGATLLPRDQSTGPWLMPPAIYDALQRSFLTDNPYYKIKLEID